MLNRARYGVIAGLLASALPAYAYDSSGTYTTVGLYDCGEYIARFDQDRKNRSGIDQMTSGFAVLNGWIGGYITAYNSLVDNGKSDVTEDVSIESVELWVANYCQTHPLDDIDDAMRALAENLESQG